MMVLILAYAAVLFSFASGMLALLTNQQPRLEALGQKYLARFPHHQSRLNIMDDFFEQSRYPILLRQAVFVLLGLSGLLALLAGL
ncbi:MAG: hydrogenase 4 subunit B, partial [Methylomonas lenta]|nr:hydrogenase 4 subunit B [Methylomonas lenta]